MSDIKLTSMTAQGGWGAKLGPDALAQVLCHLPKFSDPNLLVGFETSDDAAVYQINDELALIQTVDIFPPVVFVYLLFKSLFFSFAFWGL